MLLRHVTQHVFMVLWYSGIILGMDSANERRRYIVTPPLIGWAHTQKDPWILHTKLDLMLQSAQHRENKSFNQYKT